MGLFYTGSICVLPKASPINDVHVTHYMYTMGRHAFKKCQNKWQKPHVQAIMNWSRLGLQAPAWALAMASVINFGAMCNFYGVFNIKQSLKFGAFLAEVWENKTTAGCSFTGRTYRVKLSKGFFNGWWIIHLWPQVCQLNTAMELWQKTA